MNPYNEEYVVFGAVMFSKSRDILAMTLSWPSLLSPYLLIMTIMAMTLMLFFQSLPTSFNDQKTPLQLLDQTCSLLVRCRKTTNSTNIPFTSWQGNLARFETISTIIISKSFLVSLREKCLLHIKNLNQNSNINNLCHFDL